MRIKLSLTTALVATACLLPTDVCGCPPALGVGIVAGTVTRTDGARVAGSEVRIEARPYGCMDVHGSALVDPPITRTNAAGAYRYLMRAAAPSHDACIRVVAYDPSAAVTDSAVVEGIRMRLVASYGTREQPDSLRVDLRLR